MGSDSKLDSALDFRDSTKEVSNSLESNNKIESNKVSFERGIGERALPLEKQL